MNDSAIASGYAEGLLSLAKIEGEPYELSSELALIAEAVGSHLQLSKVLSDPGVAAAKRVEVVEEIFAGKIGKLAMAFVQAVAITGHAKLLGLMAEKYAQMLQEAFGKVVAEVTTAVAVGDGVKDLIAKELRRITGKEVVLNMRVDPQIVGGIVVRVDGKLIDGSLRTGLENLRQKMSLQEMRG